MVCFGFAAWLQDRQHPDGKHHHSVFAIALE
jgi:hypothetical protein